MLLGDNRSPSSGRNTFSGHVTAGFPTRDSSYSQHLPRTSFQWLIRWFRPHLRRRDRAGFSPDFPFRNTKQSNHRPPPQKCQVRTHEMVFPAINITIGFSLKATSFQQVSNHSTQISDLFHLTHNGNEREFLEKQPKNG